MIEAGLPNIVGTAEPLNTDAAGIIGIYTDAFSAVSVRKVLPNALDSVNHVIKLSFDASKSNDIYGNANTVQPPALSTQYLIKY